MKALMIGLSLMVSSVSLAQIPRPTYCRVDAQCTLPQTCQFGICTSRALYTKTPTFTPTPTWTPFSGGCPGCVRPTATRPPATVRISTPTPTASMTPVAKTRTPTPTPYQSRLGDPCTTDVQCGQVGYCDVVCKQRGSAGASCNRDAMCTVMLHCVSGRCVQ